MLLWNTNNKMAAPAPVQLQQQVTVSDLVFVYLSMPLRHSRHVTLSQNQTIII